MAASIEQTWKYAQVAEKELQAYLAEKDPTLRNVDQLITEYRSKCEDTIQQDFEFALTKNTENRLWEAHIKINSRFRKLLNNFRDTNSKKRMVEKRKAVAHYLRFIKSSQRFYRGYIQRLASTYGGIRELEAVAQKLSPEILASSSQTSTPRELSDAVLRSCHQTLVRLGDLSRYRETELATKEHNWGPAIGYYDLAGAIFPASGASHNQLAVIARTESNHLRATYHLYRALAVEEPHPSAKGNLEIEFKKIHTAWSRGESVANSLQRDVQGPGKALVGWFMRLHTRCYAGAEFSEHDELENEVLSQLAVDLKERSLEGTLSKFILINIAAEYFAGIRLKDSPDSPDIWQSFFFFQRLNVKTMFTLLQILQPELERQVDSEDESGPGGVRITVPEQISAVARRVLPGLRHYSSWLTSNAAVLTAQLGDSSLIVQIKELWKIYASTLTLLASTFPVPDLPSIEYLFEEDEDTLGFKPFINDRAKRRYYNQESFSIKPKWHQNGVERHHPNVEMFGRIRDFLTEGLLLAVDESVPIDLVAGTTTFAYREEGMPSEIQASPATHRATLASTMIEPQDIPQAHKSPLIHAPSLADEVVSQTTSVSVSLNTEAHRMVDILLESESADNGHHSSTIASRDLRPETEEFVDPRRVTPAVDVTPLPNIENDTTYGFNELNASDFVRALNKYTPQKQQPQCSPRPHLPSIYNSPFAPQADDATPTSRPNTATRISPLHSRKNSEQKFSPQQQQHHLNGGIFGSSSIGSMQDTSSSFNVTQTPINHFKKRSVAGNNYGAIGGPVISHSHNSSRNLDGFEFRSSQVFQGSTWDLSGQTVRDAMSLRTPPNGQGAG